MLTPLNNILYNSKPENLALHGSHPHYNHLLINFPLMFGPLLLLYFRNIILRNVESTPITMDVVKENPKIPQTCTYASQFLWTCMASIASGLIMLSIAPHQEARFLLPMLPSLALVCSNAFLNKKSLDKRVHAMEFFIEKVVGYIIRAVWILFNLSMVIFFGFFHQGGVLQASQDMRNTISDTNAHVIYYNSYFAPRSFMTSFNSSRKISVEDFAEKAYQPAAALMNRIEEMWESNRNSLVRDFAIYLYIPAPAAKSLQLPPPKHLPQMFKWTLIKEYFPHFSMENPPQWNQPLMDQLTFQCFRISSLLQIVQ